MPRPAKIEAHNASNVALAGLLIHLGDRQVPGARQPQRLNRTGMPYLRREPVEESFCSGGSKNMAQGLAGADWVMAGHRDERIHAAIEQVARTRPRIEVGDDKVLERPLRVVPGKRRNEMSFYRPRDGAQEGARFVFKDRALGVVLAQCRGNLHHVMEEAEKFVKAQSLTMAAILVEISSEEAPDEA